MMNESTQVFDELKHESSNVKISFDPQCPWFFIQVRDKNSKFPGPISYQIPIGKHFEQRIITWLLETTAHELYEYWKAWKWVWLARSRVLSQAKGLVALPKATRRSSEVGSDFKSHVVTSNKGRILTTRSC